MDVGTKIAAIKLQLLYLFHKTIHTIVHSVQGVSTKASFIDFSTAEFVDRPYCY